MNSTAYTPTLLVAAEVEGGVTDLVLDGRGRPLVHPAPADRARVLTGWFGEMGMYPDEVALNG